MAMTIAVTRNAPGRFRGYLASCMLEVAPGVYVAPRMKKPVRQRVWNTVMSWSELLPSDGGIALFWKSRNAASGLGMKVVGWPKKELVDHEGLWLATRALTAEHDDEKLAELAGAAEPTGDQAAGKSDHDLSYHLSDLTN
jgi:CRISPR-associated protein Cas2